jgi:hypothetical protein
MQIAGSHSDAREQRPVHFPPLGQASHRMNARESQETG